MVSYALISSCLVLVALQGGCADNYILDITVNCGSAKTNNPEVKILTDVAISAKARCLGGDMTFRTTDKVHYTLPGALKAGKKACVWHKRTGSNTYAVEVLVRYGEIGSLILTKDKIRTVVCTYDQYGKDASPRHRVLDNFIAPRELGTIVGATVPRNQLKLAIQDVKDKDVKGNLNMDRKYTIYGTYTGPARGVSLKPVHCDAVSGSGKRYAILRAGCGDGVIFRKSDGFMTSGKMFRSPYFEAYHIDGSVSMSIECQVTLCRGCDGSSCSTVCAGPPNFSVANGRRGSCRGGYKYRGTCTYLCNRGFSKRFDGVSTCGIDGVWTTPKIQCVARSCGTPPALRNGRRSYKSTSFPNAAAYSCNPGYNMRGSGVVRCQLTGRWSALPTCIAKTCGTPPGLKNGKRSYRSVAFPNAASYSCNAGYQLRGSGTVRCQANGKWGTLPTCVLASCGSPPSVSYASRKVSSTTYRGVATYSCVRGYLRRGPPTSVCQSNKRWSIAPTCAPRNCGTAPGIANGYRVYRYTSYPNRAIYSCRSGFSLRGSRYVNCNSNGRFSANRPRCVIKNCGKPPASKFARVAVSTTTYNSRALYSCLSGYNRSGSRSILCLSSGRWSRPPKCVPKNCGRPPTLKNGKFQAKSWTYNNVAKYSCNVSYRRTGTTAIKCLSTGKWSTFNTKCTFTKITCKKFGLRGLAAIAKITGYKENDYAILACKKGYRTIYPKSKPDGRINCINGRYESISFRCQALKG